MASAAAAGAQSRARHPSRGEETFALHCRCNLPPEMQPQREHVFAPGRRWRFDFAWPAQRLAVEVEGGTFLPISRHTSATGFEKDTEKYNEAALLGWRVLRFTTRQITSGQAIEVVKKALTVGAPSEKAQQAFAIDNE